jgi:uncharacterized membrane protein YphA (DoxX/SURF4 family)
MGALRLQPFGGIMAHLGYPGYFTTIIGAAYLLAGVALLAPRFPRLKEWAYAGLVFVYTGAIASRAAMKDDAVTLVAPFVFAGIAFASWALRPPARRDSTQIELPRLKFGFDLSKEGSKEEDEI